MKFLKNRLRFTLFILAIFAIGVILGNSEILSPYPRPYSIPNHSTSSAPQSEFGMSYFSSSTISEFYTTTSTFAVEGRNLKGVDIYSIPTGTGITRNSWARMGSMKKQADNNGAQSWVMDISCPGLATNVVAIGWNQNGQEVGELYLPYYGATDIAAALCPNEVR